ncbi:MAG: hypothetical protein ACK4N5_16735, partial [Myxococcales bacterium]
MNVDVATPLALFGTFLVLTYGAWLLADRGEARKQLPLLLGGGVVLLLLGIPGVMPPVFGPHSRGIVLGCGMLAAAAFLAVHARRARGSFSRDALAREARSVADAVQLLGSGDGPVDVVLRGRLAGDPQLLAPVSNVPCAQYRYEVRRARAGERADAGDLMAMDEGGCDRILLEDRSGRVALTGAPALLARGAPLQETVVEGEVDAERPLAEGG